MLSAEQALCYGVYVHVRRVAVGRIPVARGGIRSEDDADLLVVIVMLVWYKHGVGVRPRQSGAHVQRGGLIVGSRRVEE